MPDAQYPLGRFFPDAQPPQAPADVAVIIPTIMRECILTAVQCIYDQDFEGRVQIVIGSDQNWTHTPRLYSKLDARPPHVSGLVLTLPYSTSVRHGGIHNSLDGGALRAILSYAANARYVAYLDDDNTWSKDHLSLLMTAVQGKAWAYTQRMLVDEVTDKDLAVDIWHSAGPDAGEFAADGGLVDPNCLLVDKLAAADVFGYWAEPARGGPSYRSDRRFFRGIKDLPHGRVEATTVRYKIRRRNHLYKSMGLVPTD